MNHRDFFDRAAAQRDDWETDETRVRLREMARALSEGGTLVICHGNSRQTINQIHHSAGDVVARDMAPDVNETRQLFYQAQLHPLDIRDAPDRYIAAARKDTRDR